MRSASNALAAGVLALMAVACGGTGSAPAAVGEPAAEVTGPPCDSEGGCTTTVFSSAELLTPAAGS